MDGREPRCGTDLRRGHAALRIVVALLALGSAVACLPATALAAEPLSLWHAYRGDERAGIEAAVAAWNEAHPEAPAVAQAIPYEALSAKLEAAIPHGNGPDVFVFAHERVGKWSRAGLARPVDEGEEGAFPGLFSAPAAEAMRADGRAWGLPLATKCLALFYDPHAVPRAPETTDALVAAARAATDPRAGRYGLGWLAGDFYFHAAFLHGFGGAVFDPGGGLSLDSPLMVRSLALARDLAVTLGIAPDEPSSTLLSQLFNEGRLAMVLSGPWFLGEIAPGRTFSVAPLPRISETGQPMRPFLTVEAAWVSARSPRPGPAQALAAFLASGPGARIRAVRGGQTVAARAVLEDPGFGRDPVAAVFARQAALAVPMPSRPEMDAVWEPANQALRKLLRGDLEPEAAARFAQRRTEQVLRPPPPSRSPLPLVAGTGIACLGGATWALRRARGKGIAASARRAWPAYLYVGPAFLGLGLLSFLPFAVGGAVSLFAHRAGTWSYVGLAHYASILLSRDYGLADPLSFWSTAAVTVLWTALNVALHVGIGLALALLLRDPWVRLRGLWRVLLVVPWAVPNYITALIWKGMFHRQFGAVNALLVALGLEPVSWFAKFSTAFAANVATNTWLGFPFMMVVTLGALQAIPRELEEAAEVDGASRWQRFRHVTWPMLLPALAPAVVLGSVWTFNQFNIIYLVSAGEPDGSTDILISQAYKWAFERQAQYGYAAAYAALIFVLLVAYSRFTDRLLGRLSR